MSSTSSTVLAWQDAVPTVQPLDTVADLLTWTPEPADCLCQAIELMPQVPVAAARQAPCQQHHERGTVASVALQRPVMPCLPLQRRDGGLGAPRPRLLACHDMRGGYLEDRLVQGGGDADAYTFRHWHAVDGLVYFSHRLVTVPPPGWVNAGHLHGVEVLGTLITEWGAGAAACDEMLATWASAERAARQLARLAAHLGFDGWLVNVENAVDAAAIPTLLHFLRQLTYAMHAAVPHSKVIWYDAVTVEGKLEWQNELNPFNSPFFDATDGLWVNYTWMPPALHASRAAAGGRPWDVYVGIDCFGRGTLGGGGMRCDLALQAAQEAGLSAAMFGIGWPFEVQEECGAREGAVPAQQECGAWEGAVPAQESPPALASAAAWRDRDEEFWRRILLAWWGKAPRVVLCALPAASDFSTGAGRSAAHAGSCLRPAAWYNLSLQSLQPLLSLAGGEPEGLQVGVTSDVAYSGGSSVRLSGVLAAPGVAVVRLFRAAADAPPAGLRVTWTAAVTEAAVLRVRLHLERPGGAAGGVEHFTLDLGPPGPASADRDGMQDGVASLAAFRPATQLGRAAFVAPEAAAASPASDGAASAGAPPLGHPRQWATWQCAVGAAELPAWPLAGSTITAVDAVVGPKVPGAACFCDCYLGALGIEALLAGRDGGSGPAPGGVGPRGVRATQVQLRRGVGPGGGVVATLSALLTWAAPAGSAQRHFVWARCGPEGSSPGGGAADPQEEPPCERPWERPRFLGVACAPAYAVAGLVLPLGATAVRFYVASGAGSTALRHATAVTVAMRDVRTTGDPLS